MPREKITESSVSVLERLHESLQNQKEVSEDLVRHDLSLLSRDVQIRSKEKFDQSLEVLQKNFQEYQSQIDGFIGTTVGVAPENFRSKWNEISRMSSEEQKSFFENSENKWFLEGTNRLISQVEDFLKQKEPNFFQKIVDRYRAVPDAFQRGMDQGITPNGAYLGLLTLYAGSFSRTHNSPSSGPGFLLKSFALGAVAGILPSVTAPAFKILEATVEGAKDVAVLAGKTAFNTFMFLPRGGDSPEFILDGKWKSTRVKEHIFKYIDQLDQETRTLVPDKISSWYFKIIDRKGDSFSQQDAFSAAEFCAQSLDLEVFFSRQQFEDLKVRIKKNEWKNISEKEIWKMLNTAYANRTLEYFLSLPASDPIRISFETHLSALVARLVGGKETPKLDVSELYGDKISSDIRKKQHFGIAAEMYHGGLKSFVGVVMMIYAAFAGVTSVSQWQRKEKAEKEKEKKEDSFDALKSKSVKKIEKAFSKSSYKSSDVESVLDALVAGAVISSALAKSLSHANPEKFFQTLSAKNFQHGLSTKSLSQVYQEFRNAINSLSDIDLGKKSSLAEIHNFLDKDELLANYSSLDRRLKQNGNIPSLYVYVLDPASPTPPKYQLFSLTNIKKKTSLSGVSFSATFDGKSDLHFSLSKKRNGDIEFSPSRKIADNPRVIKGADYKVSRITFEQKNVAGAQVLDLASGKSV